MLYGKILLPFNTFFMLQNTFQSFLVTAERPNLGLGITVAAGMTNIVLDALFVAVFRWGIAGAAVATAVSQLVGGGVALLYFILPNKCPLSLGKAGWDGKAFLKTCTNGSSELSTNLSLSLVNMLYNFQLMRLVGEDGVAAYGVIMYVNFIFISTYLGYSIGVAPIIGFHFGAGNRVELRSLRKKSLVIIGIGSALMTVIGELLAHPLSAVFVGYDAELLLMTERAFMLYSLSFLLIGFNIFASAAFTALNNGLVSAIISFLRTLLFQVAAVLLLPLVLDLDGVWLAIVAAELLAFLISLFFYGRMKERYGY